MLQSRRSNAPASDRTPHPAHSRGRGTVERALARDGLTVQCENEAEALIISDANFARSSVCDAPESPDTPVRCRSVERSSQCCRGFVHDRHAGLEGIRESGEEPLHGRSLGLIVIRICRHRGHGRQRHSSVHVRVLMRMPDHFAADERDDQGRCEVHVPPLVALRLVHMAVGARATDPQDASAKSTSPQVAAIRSPWRAPVVRATSQMVR
jgi:hypothetical protein